NSKHFNVNSHRLRCNFIFLNSLHRPSRHQRSLIHLHHHHLQSKFLPPPQLRPPLHRNSPTILLHNESKRKTPLPIPSPNPPPRNHLRPHANHLAWFPRIPLPSKDPRYPIWSQGSETGIYYALQYLALSDATVLQFLAPILTGYFGRMVL